VNVSTKMYFDTGHWYQYGYTWWGVPGYTFYEATGHYEQKIFVLPEEDIVVVFTGDIQDEDWHPSDYFVIECIIPAAEGPIPIDPVPFINLSVIAIIIVPLPIVFLRRRFR
jgi:hypothetical protein